MGMLRFGRGMRGYGPEALQVYVPRSWSDAKKAAFDAWWASSRYSEKRPGSSLNRESIFAEFESTYNRPLPTPVAPINAAAKYLVDQGVKVEEANAFASVWPDLQVAQSGMDVSVASLVLQLGGKDAASRVLFLQRMSKASAEEQIAAGWVKKRKATVADIVASARKVLSASREMKYRMKGLRGLRGLRGFVSGTDINAILTDLQSQGFEVTKEEVEAVAVTLVEDIQEGTSSQYVQTTSSNTTVTSPPAPPPESSITASLPTLDFFAGTSNAQVTPLQEQTLTDLAAVQAVSTAETQQAAASTTAAQDFAAAGQVPATTPPAPSAPIGGGAPGVYSPLQQVKKFVQNRSPMVDAKTGEGSTGLGTLAIIGTVLYFLGG